MPLAVTHNLVKSGYTGEQFNWFDSNCRARSAFLVYNDRTDPAGHKGGYLRDYLYLLANGTPRQIEGSSTAHPGWGYTVNHFGTSSAQGHNVLGTWQLVFAGRHHAILRFVRRIELGAAVDTTVDWLFATGKDHPVWAVTFDASPAGPDQVNADTRSPYGDLKWDGGVNANVDGVAWGDHYRFRSLAAPVTLQSGWDYTTPNTVPYVQMWSNAADAEMGAVQTQTMAQHDAGGGFFYPAWGTSDADGPMPQDFNWTYQLNQYELPFGSTSKRMAWGSNYGAVGRNSYPAYGEASTRDGYPYQSYAVHMVLGQHSADPTAAQVTQVERLQGLALAASVGSVKLTGPAGIARPDNVTWAPAGYNPAYGAFEFVAAGNALQATLTPNQGMVRNPVLVINNFTAAGARVDINGTRAIPDVDYFASVDSVGQRLWLTLRREVQAPVALAISENPVLFEDGFE